MLKKKVIFLFLDGLSDIPVDDKSYYQKHSKTNDKILINLTTIFYPWPTQTGGLTFRIQK